MPPDNVVTPSSPYSPQMRPFYGPNGEELEPFYYRNQAPTELGFFSGSALESGTVWLDSRQRWASLFDGDRTVATQEQVQELAGDREVQLPSGLTLSEVERRLEWFDGQQYKAKYTTGLWSQLTGGFFGGLLDPVNVLTLPVGGTNSARAIGATTLRQFTKESAVAGVKVAAASAPLEAIVQQRTRGEVDPLLVGTTAAGGLVMPGLLAGFSRGVRGAFNRLKNQGQVADMVENRAVPRENPGVMDRAIDEYPGDIAAPPIRQATVEPAPPRARLQETFEDYPGGWQRFVLDAAQEAPGAVAYGRAVMGVDTNSAHFKEFLGDVAGFTADSRIRQPAELAQLLDDLNTHRGGAATPEAARRLRTANMVDEHGNIEIAFEKVGINANATNKFFRDGPEAEWRRKTKAANKRVQQTAAKLAEEQAAGKVTTRTGNAAAKARENLRQLLDRGRVLAVDRLNPDELMNVIELSRVQFNPSLAARARTAQEPPGDIGKALAEFDTPDPRMEDIRAQAREVGLPEEVLESVGKDMRAVVKEIVTCGVA